MNRRNAIALTPAEQAEYLRNAHTVILTSLDRQGYPHPVAMWFTVDADGSVLMTTFRKAQKAVNLRRDPRCALLVESGQTYPELKGLMIRGKAVIDDDTEHVLDALEAINRKYQQWPGDGLREAMRGQASKRCLIRIVPERIASWDHAKLGAGVY